MAGGGSRGWKVGGGSDDRGEAPAHDLFTPDPFSPDDVTAPA
jgi:hypothetical protein